MSPEIGTERVKRRIRDSRVVIITNLVVISNVGIKRVVCIPN